MDEVQKTINEIISKRDEIINRLKAERDDVIEYYSCEQQYANMLKKERDEARRCAEQMRDLYAAEVDESIEAFPWPWEADE